MAYQTALTMDYPINGMSYKYSVEKCNKIFFSMKYDRIK